MRRIAIILILLAGTAWMILLINSIRMMDRMRKYGVTDFNFLYESISFEILGLLCATALPWWILSKSFIRTSAIVALFSIVLAIFTYVINTASSTS